MTKALTLKELGDLDAALKRAGIAITKNMNVKLGQQSEPLTISSTTTVSAGSDKPATKRGPKPKDKTDAPVVSEEKPVA
jgi:hypothetical protein